MEAAAAAASSTSVAFSKSKWPLYVPSLPSSSVYHQTPFSSLAHAISPLCLGSSQNKQLLHVAVKGRGRGALRSSANSVSAVASSERWLLEPVGDGDSRHIGFKVPLPDAFVIASDSVTVGRVPDKADVVIPVATVSALHARLEKKGGDLFITDLDSTNGTYIDDKRLRPGAVTTVPPGCRVIFGDVNLAMFRVSKIVEEEVNANEEVEKPNIETSPPDAST
ncbi:hypothetical protein Cni_G24700 [Canna indica]|uniref:FHA domain-containing protein n=1 Tax=Canna indica TaxID=4628 RepID=A0AAQ3KWC8_9LILI|nr:hypothetical protein Cni_G24700 [Canna indica]